MATSQNPSRTNIMDGMPADFILYNGGIRNIVVGWLGFNKWKATWLNAGVPAKNIPPRPFLDAGRKGVAQALSKYLRKRFGVTHARPFTRKEIAAIKLFVKAYFKRIIAGWKRPRNRPSTIARKGRNDPLVDTGSMRDSVRVWVTMRRGFKQ